MPKFRITTSAPAVQYWYFEVEAESQDEAEDMVLNGNVTPYDSEFDVVTDEETIEEVSTVAKQ